MLKLINTFILIALVASCGLFSYIQFRAPSTQQAKTSGHISKTIPQNPKGWTSEELPLGNTPELERATRKTLLANEYFNREYKSKDKSFVVYIAYWKKGQEGTANASSHTPDRCWVQNGWENHKDMMKYAYEMPIVRGQKLMPAYYRFLTFETKSGEKISRNVMFWHVTEGKRYDYGKGSTRVRNPLDYLKNAFIASFIGSPEQYFIRIDTSDNCDELLKDEGFQEVLSALGKMALAEDSKADTSKQESDKAK